MQYTEPTVCICNAPLNLLTHKLTIADMRMIADKHGIRTLSRVQSAELQTVLNNHICVECLPFVQVFDVIRQVDRREAQLRATKKYQSKKGEEFVHLHREAVKKYQLKKGEEFVASHLESVRKYQSKEGDNFSASNMESVKKYQTKNGDEFAASNLESVKTYQSKKGQDFTASNLESVQTYQSKRGKDFVACNLESAKKYQCKKGEDFATSNLKSVKTYQFQKGDDFVTSNLKSVKFYQHKKGDDFVALNLESVKMYQSNKGADFVASNLESVKDYQVKKGEKYKMVNLESSKSYQERQGPDYLKVNLKSTKKYQKEKDQVYKTANLELSKKWQASQGEKYKISNLLAAHRYQDKKYNKSFPPPPPSQQLQHMIISNACDDMDPRQFVESGCAVCGRLTPLRNLHKLVQSGSNLSILDEQGITRQERFYSTDPIKNLDGPAIEHSLDSICISCHTTIGKGKIPIMALANGKWIGEIPAELSCLSFAEQLLIARVRHNRCIVRVSSGMHKMRANAITFTNPIPKVYNILPPPLEDLDEVLAFIYTGPCKPTEADFARTPLLVRQNQVKVALDWLKLNHSDYYDLEISQKNLNQYPECGAPVVVDYRKSFSNKNLESTAVNDSEEEDGTEAGKCPFVVHGLTGEEYTTKSLKALKAIALKHLTSNRKILAIGHEAQPESIYDNPQLFPQMLPWLFPYGLGGIGNTHQQGHVSDIAHKRHLLMYHDKRFQKDPYFPLIAFNHEQIKESTTGGYLLVNKSKFEGISKRLMDIDTYTLSRLAKRMEDGERITPELMRRKIALKLSMTWMK
jgi:hypothetical protein